MKAVAVYSGGLDSSVLLYELSRSSEQLAALSFHYGQRHAKELSAASEICRRIGVEHQIIDLRTISGLLTGSALTDETAEVPEGHYTDASMRATIVPNRNMIMLAIAGACALSSGADTIAYAAHSGDHTIYPDCRPEFVEAMQRALGLCDWEKLELYAPYLQHSKSEIVRRGARLGVPFELTWSCYRGGAYHCGRCGTCVERREAFEQAGVADPTRYDSPTAVDLAH